MGAYESFASVYDLFMEDVNYDEWVDYVEKIFSEFNIKPELVCELGCGTGRPKPVISARLAPLPPKSSRIFALPSLKR